MRIKSLDKGFTLIELIVVLSCAAVLVALSATTWWHYAEKIQQNTVIYTIKSGLMYARQLAVREHKNIIYCGSADLKHCDGDWQHHHIIKTDVHGAVLKVYNFENKKMTIDFYANFGADQCIEFTPQGTTHGQQGHFRVCLAASDASATQRCKWLMLHFSGNIVEMSPAD